MGKKKWNETLVDSAKGRLIHEWTLKEKFLSGFINTLDVSYLRNVDPNCNRLFIKSLTRVKSEARKSMAKQILTQFLVAQQLNTNFCVCVCCMLCVLGF